MRPALTPRRRRIVVLAPLGAAMATLGAASSLGSCNCGDAETTTGPRLDAGTGLDGAAGFGGHLGADACEPKVCTPCDCGPLDDGCGHTLECEPCAPVPSCAQSYGEVIGFELCEETDTQCSFRAIKNGDVTCGQICAAYGGECLATFSNGSGCDSIYYDAGDFGCDVAEHDDDVCVCTRRTNDYQPMPCVDASVPSDAEPPSDAGPPTGSELLYRVNFENGTTGANPGASHEETVASENGGGTIDAVDNPQKDSRNDSDRVGRHRVPAGYRRAELSSGRLPTAGRTYLYKVSYFIPSSFFAYHFNWNLISQWKSYPCGDHTTEFGAAICGSCGIFDDLTAGVLHFRFKYRAEPDCYDVSPSMLVDQWVDFVEEIRWTNDATGYVKVWQNGQLVTEQAGFKTLFDGFHTGECDIYWGVGIYANSDEGLTLYTDDIEIWAP